MRRSIIALAALTMLLLSGCGTEVGVTMQECTENHNKIHKMSELQYPWCAEK